MAKFVRLTDPDGNEVWIAPQWVTKVRSPMSNRHAANTRALVVMATIEQAVCETVAEVLKALEEVS